MKKIKNLIKKIKRFLKENSLIVAIVFAVVTIALYWLDDVFTVSDVWETTFVTSAVILTVVTSFLHLRHSGLVQDEDSYAHLMGLLAWIFPRQWDEDNRKELSKWVILEVFLVLGVWFSFVYMAFQDLAYHWTFWIVLIVTVFVITGVMVFKIIAWMTRIFFSENHFVIFLTSLVLATFWIGSTPISLGWWLDYWLMVINPYILYGGMVVVFALIWKNHRHDLSKNLGMISWIAEMRSSELKFKYLLEFILALVLLVHGIWFAFVVLEYNWLFWVVMVVSFFVITGVAIFKEEYLWYLGYVLIPFVYLVAKISKFYYRFACRSMRKIEKAIKPELMEGGLGEYKEIYLRNYWISETQAWKRLQKFGSLEQIMWFWRKYRRRIRTEDFIGFDLLDQIQQKLEKTDMSYRLSLFVPLLEWFYLLKESPLRYLKVSPDVFVTRIQSFFDLMLDKLPTYDDKIYLNFVEKITLKDVGKNKKKINEVTMKMLLNGLCMNLPKYLRDSKAERAEEVRKFFVAKQRKAEDAAIVQSEELEILLSKADLECQDALLDEFKKLKNKLEDDPYSVMSCDIEELTERLKERVQLEQHKAEAREDVQFAKTVDVFTSEYLENSVLSESDLKKIIKVRTPDFLVHYDPKDAIPVTVVKTKGKVNYPIKSVEAFLHNMFILLKKSQEDEQITRILDVITSTYEYLMGYTDFDLSMHLLRIKNAWEKKSRETLALIAFPSTFLSFEKWRIANRSISEINLREEYSKFLIADVKK